MQDQKHRQFQLFRGDLWLQHLLENNCAWNSNRFEARIRKHMMFELNLAEFALTLIKDLKYYIFPKSEKTPSSIIWLILLMEVVTQDQR